MVLAVHPLSWVLELVVGWGVAHEPSDKASRLRWQPGAQSRHIHRSGVCSAGSIECIYYFNRVSIFIKRGMDLETSTDMRAPG